MTETLEVTAQRKMTAYCESETVRLRKQAEKRAKDELWAEGLHFYSASLAYQYQTLREDLRMQCGEEGNGRLVVNLAEQMAMVRAQDEDECWQDRWDREILGEVA